MSSYISNERPEYDALISKIADYIVAYNEPSQTAIDTAILCLADALGCAMLALTYPACTKLLGPWVSGMHIEQGARVLGTKYELDPVKAAFDIGTMVRWLDFNDTWLAKEWGHPSDNLGAIIAVMDFVSRRSHEYANRKFTMQDLLLAMIKTYEIQGVLAIENSFNQVGLDHVLLVKVASSGVAAHLMGANRQQIQDVLTQAWLDGQSLRTYRHAPNTGSRKSWAAGDATSRALRLAMMVLQGEMGYPSVLTASKWGFQDVLFKSNPVSLKQDLNCYVMENILLKIAYPAEFHAQTAVECAFKIHPALKSRLNDIKDIVIHTHASAMRIIDKTGPLHNPADRDHCMQYMVACGLAFGELTAESYEDSFAQNSMIDQLRSKMRMTEHEPYSVDYLDPQKRSIANRVVITLNDGTVFDEACEYPIGHRRRRAEGIPFLWEKFAVNVDMVLDSSKRKQIETVLRTQSKLLSMPVSEFVDMWVH